MWKWSEMTVHLQLLLQVLVLVAQRAQHSRASGGCGCAGPGLCLAGAVGSEALQALLQFLLLQSQGSARTLLPLLFAACQWMSRSSRLKLLKKMKNPSALAKHGS